LYYNKPGVDSLSTKTQNGNAFLNGKLNSPTSASSHCLAFMEKSSNHTYKEASCFCEHLCNTGLYESEADVRDNLDSLVKEVHDWLDAKDYKMARVVMDIMMKENVGEIRDDKITPQVLHELTQAIWFISLLEDGIEFDDPELVLSLILAHDLGEDHDIRPEELEKLLNEKGIPSGERMDRFLRGFDAISKYYGEEEHLAFNEAKNRNEGEARYQKVVRENHDASIAKIIDRPHNVKTLVGVRIVNKIHKEIAKAERFYEKSLVRDMRKRFPKNARFYTIMDKLLKSQLSVSRHYTVPDGDPLPSNDVLRSRMPKKGFPFMPAGLHPLLVIAERIRKEFPDIYANPTGHDAYNELG